MYDSPRAMSKLLKEAKRLKKVLIANTEHVAQVLYSPTPSHGCLFVSPGGESN